MSALNVEQSKNKRRHTYSIFSCPFEQLHALKVLVIYISNNNHSAILDRLNAALLAKESSCTSSGS